MALITLNDVDLAYGHVPLLAKASFALEPRERVGLIGRNGTGKSSLLALLAGRERPDDGQVVVQQNVTRVSVAQEPAFDAATSVFDAVGEGLAEVRALRARYEAHAPGDDLDALQARIEALDGWTWEQRVDEVLHRLALDPAAILGELSGGTAKRVALARALVARPDVLLLDEPTNHLDLDGILWLQTLIAESNGAVVVVTHDRAFLDAVATRIVELDRGVLRSYPGPPAAGPPQGGRAPSGGSERSERGGVYATYEATKAEQLHAQALAFAREDKLLAQEEVWIRKGVEARRTRSIGRVRRLETLRVERAARREQIGSVRLSLDHGAASGKLVAELEDVSVAFGDKVVLRDVNVTVLRGDRIGILGPNGAGKTTLLNVILGSLQPQRGSVRRGARVEVAYFDQQRAGLDLSATLADTISPGSDYVEVGGQRKHVMSYLDDFLFSPQRARSPVSSLSGGERSRVLLARLFARPANVLVLDEPTNDLDIDTLELLEELLQSYAGTVFLVSHDRRFVDNVVTGTIVAEGDGRWREYEGGVEDWLLQSARAAALAAASTARPAATRSGSARLESAGLESARLESAPGAARAGGRDAAAAGTPGAAASPAAKPAGARRKLTYKEQRELSELPARIAALEAEQTTLAATMAAGDLYRESPDRIAAVHARHGEIEDELMHCLERWQSLDGG